MMQDLFALNAVTSIGMSNPARAADLEPPCPWIWNYFGLDALTRVTSVSGLVPVSFVDKFKDTLLTLTNDKLEYHSELSTWPNLQVYEGVITFPTMNPNINVPDALHTLNLTLPLGVSLGSIHINQNAVYTNCSLRTFTYTVFEDSPVSLLPPCVENVIFTDRVAWHDTDAAAPKSIKSLVALGSVETLPWLTFANLENLENLELRLTSSVVDNLVRSSTLYPSGPLKSLRLELTEQTDKLETLLCKVFLLDEDLESLEVYADVSWAVNLPSCLHNLTSLKTLRWPFPCSAESLLALSSNDVTSLSVEIPHGWTNKVSDFTKRFSRLESLSLTASADDSKERFLTMGSFSKLVNLTSFELVCVDTDFALFFDPTFPTHLKTFRIQGCLKAAGALPASGYENLVKLEIVDSGFNSWPMLSGSAPALQSIIITGCPDFIDMPSDASFASMKALVNLQISSVVSAALPQSLFAASSSLQSISLRLSQASMPAHINNTKLSNLNIELGSLPAGIPRLPELSQPSSLFQVSIKASGITGSIPSSWSSQWFANLDLSGNHLSGALLAPPSFTWSDDATYVRDLPFETASSARSQQINLSQNELTGAIFNASKYPIASIDLSHTEINMCGGNKSSLSAVWGGPQICKLSSVSCACLADFAACAQDYNSTCPGSSPVTVPQPPPVSSDGCPQWTERSPTPIIGDVPVYVPTSEPVAVPSVAPVHAPIAAPTPHSTPAPTFKSCLLPGPQPADLFHCIEGVWTTLGDITVSSPIRLTGPATVHVNGSLTFSKESGFPAFVFVEGFGQLVVTGCILGNGYAETEVILNHKLVDKLYNATIPTHPTLITSPRLDSECPQNSVDMRAAKLKISMVNGSTNSVATCKRIGAIVSGHTTRHTLTIILQPDHSNCNLKVLLPLFGAIAAGAVIVGLIVLYWWRQRRASDMAGSGYYDINTHDDDY